MLLTSIGYSLMRPAPGTTPRTSEEEDAMKEGPPPHTEWDERFAQDAYVYGTEPNDFLRAFASKLPPPPARVLSLAEGEGRNGVYLAGLGHEVTAVDSSRVGLEKARRLADEKGVEIETVQADLASYAIEPAAWDVVVSIFCHLPPELRRRVHRQVVEGLRPGGMVLLEAYTPEQLRHRTGGPPRLELLYTAELLREDFAGLEFLHLEELERDVTEGILHRGLAAVVQLLARKPV